MNRHRTAALILALAAATASADDGLPRPIRIFHGSGAKLVVDDLDKSALSKSWTKTRATPPHRLVNPAHKAFEFEGPEVRVLLRDTGLDHARYVYAIGSDGYQTMLPAEVVRKRGVLLAFERDGQRLTPTLGEQQLVFPTEAGSPVPSRYRARSSFWTWYVRAFVVGELPNVLQVGGRAVAMRALGKDKAPARYAPPSIVRVGDGKCPPVVEVPLSEIPGVAVGAKVSALTLYRDAIPPAEGYRLLKASTATSLPVECGGPFILVKPGRAAARGKYAPDDLLYLVYGVAPAP